MFFWESIFFIRYNIIIPYMCGFLVRECPLFLVFYCNQNKIWLQYKWFSIFVYRDYISSGTKCFLVLFIYFVLFYWIIIIKNLQLQSFGVVECLELKSGLRKSNIKKSREDSAGLSKRWVVDNKRNVYAIIIYVTRRFQILDFSL